MKKKLLTLLLAVCATLCLCLGLSACNTNNPDDGDNGGTEHTHTYATEWLYDADYHWHECTASGNCDAKEKDKAAHTFNENGVCTVCNYDNDTDSTGGNEQGGDTGGNTGDTEQGGSSGNTNDTEQGGTSGNEEQGGTGGNTGDEENPTHTHVYDQKVATETYLKSKATCTAKAVYYYSCSCGETGTATFEYGELAAHTPVSANNGTAATCTAAGKESDTICSVCKKTLSTGAEIPLAEHNYVDGVCTVCKNLQIYDLLTFTLSSGENYYSVTGCDNSATEVIIPSTYNDKPVTGIGASAFAGCTALTSIEIPDSVTSIGSGAFEDCTALTSVYYAGSAENWSKISINNSNNANLTNAARYYYSATKPVIKNVYWYYSDGGAVKIWDEEIVYDNSSVAGKTFTFSSCTVTVADWYWAEIKDAANKNELPGDNWAVNMVKNADSKEEYEAAYTEYIAGVEKDGYIKFEDDTFSVADNIYTNISSQKYVVVDGYVYSYPDGTLITDVPEGNTFTIFYAMVISGKTPITITSEFTCDEGNPTHTHVYDQKVTTETYLKSAATCKAKAVYYYSCSCGETGTATFEYGDVAEHNYVDGVCTVCKNSQTCDLLTFTLFSDGTYYIVTGCDNSATEVIIPSTYNDKPVTSIGGGAFWGCTALTSIEIPDSVKSIESGAFEYCTSLTSIDIPDSVWSIEDWAFNGCTSLTSIDIPDSVWSIGSCAFDGCTSLTSIDIPDSVTSIGDWAFCNCTSLQSVTIGNSVWSIGKYAFRYCTSLKDVTIGNSVTYIGDSAFDGCTSLEYTAHNNACYLGNDNNPYVVLVKAESTYITSCTINEKTMVIYDLAFQDCTLLTSIDIPDSVTSIGNCAFYNCTSLQSVTIGNGVTSIGGSAFAWCTSLTSVNFENTSGWWYADDSDATSGTEISSADLADPATAATYLTSTYCWYYWTCGWKRG